MELTAMFFLFEKQVKTLKIELPQKGSFFSQNKAL